MEASIVMLWNFMGLFRSWCVALFPLSITLNKIAMNAHLTTYRRLCLRSLCPIIILVLFTACSSPQDTAAVQRDTARNAADTLVGGYCDGCELMYTGMPGVIQACDTSAGWPEPGRKLLVTGTVFRKDGHTPAPGVIIYYWHTDDKGLYADQEGLDRRVLRHGHIRGWLQTDSAGTYALYTIRPRAYPDQSEPEHIHIAIKEPGLAKEYYIDELVFGDDPLLAPAIRRRARENRGGSGILHITQQGDLALARHNIVLGLNIPNYPR